MPSFFLGQCVFVTTINVTTDKQTKERRDIKYTKFATLKPLFLLCAPHRCLSLNPLSPLRIVLKMKNLYLTADTTDNRAMTKTQKRRERKSHQFAVKLSITKRF